jgi:hypothetical protein
MRFYYHPTSRGLSYHRSSPLFLAKTEISRRAEKCFKCNYRLYSSYKHNLYFIFLCVLCVYVRVLRCVYVCMCVFVWGTLPIARLSESLPEITWSVQPAGRTYMTPVCTMCVHTHDIVESFVLKQ